MKENVSANSKDFLQSYLFTFMSMYAIGRRMGVAIYDPNRFKWLPKGQMEKARKWVEQYGFWVVLANRFLSTFEHLGWFRHL